MRGRRVCGSVRHVTAATPTHAQSGALVSTWELENEVSRRSGEMKETKLGENNERLKRRQAGINPMFHLPLPHSLYLGSLSL